MNSRIPGVHLGALLGRQHGLDFGHELTAELAEAFVKLPAEGLEPGLVGPEDLADPALLLQAQAEVPRQGLDGGEVGWLAVPALVRARFMPLWMM